MTMQAAIYGRPGKNPQTRTTRNGKEMATCSIAVDLTAHNAEEKATQWLNVICFGTAAEQLERHGKGDLVSLSGRVVLNRWQGQDGEDREQLQIIADSVISAHRPTWRSQEKAHRRQRSAIQ